MKVKMVSMAFTGYGVLEKGQILTDEKYPQSFLEHLVTQAGAAERLDYETKVDMGYEPVKKPLSSQSLPQAKASRDKTVKKPDKRRKSSR